MKFRIKTALTLVLGFCAVILVGPKTKDLTSSDDSMLKLAVEANEKVSENLKAVGNVSSDCNSPRAPLKRLRPPRKLADTWDEDASPFNSFEDDEIVRVLPVLEDKVASDKLNIPVWRTRDGKHVLLQQDSKTCGGTVATMLLLDHGGVVNSGVCTNKRSDLAGHGGVSFETLESDLRVGLSGTSFSFKMTAPPGFSTVAQDRDPKAREHAVAELAELIKKQGPAIVNVEGHYVVVDAIEESIVRLRDPFHGWQVDVKRSAFTRVSPGSVAALQVVPK